MAIHFITFTLFCIHWTVFVFFFFVLNFTTLLFYLAKAYGKILILKMIRFSCHGTDFLTNEKCFEATNRLSLNFFLFVVFKISNFLLSMNLQTNPKTIKKYLKRKNDQKMFLLRKNFKSRTFLYYFHFTTNCCQFFLLVSFVLEIWTPL